MTIMKKCSMTAIVVLLSLSKYRVDEQIHGYSYVGILSF